MGLPVKCHAGDKVGEYVPFFFCPRSIMLYIFHMDNMPSLSYHGGQGPIVHLELDVERVIAWADSEAVSWAFTTANAAAAYTPFFHDEEKLDAVDWEAVGANDFRDSRIKDGKQAEFLVKDFVPWELVERMGTRSEEVREEALAAISESDHQPPVEVCRDWYF